ncbi:MAG TPA: site-specific integrase [Oculatellaceae cyanobacterium]
MKLVFSEAKVRAIKAAEKGKRDRYWDAGAKGLMLRVSDTGKKSFYFSVTRNGKEVLVNIGEYGDFGSNSGLTVQQARDIAASHYADVCRDLDPADAKRKAKAEVTVRELFTTYMDGYAKNRVRTWKTTESNYLTCFSHWDNRKASSVTRLEVQKCINQIGTDRGKHLANRALNDLKAIYNWGFSKNVIECANPCVGVDKCKVESGGRQRFIQPLEFEPFMKAVNEEPNKDIRDFVLLALYTAMREGNVLAMRWEKISWERKTWHIPGSEFKNGDPQDVTLTEEALGVLRGRYSDETEGWVFPSAKSESGHLVEPKTGWKRILDRAKLTDLRIHDLRRTMGSYMAIANVNAPLIGKALGHKSLAAAARYQRVNYEPVRAAMEQAQALFGQFAKPGASNAEG